MNNKKSVNDSMDDYYYAKYIKYRNKCNNLKRKVNSRTQMGGRFLKGGVIHRDKLDQVHFWLHQFDEHVVIISLGIEVDPDKLNPPKVSMVRPTYKPNPYVDNAGELKAKGIELHLRIKEFMDRVFVSKGIDEEKVILDEGDFSRLGTEELSADAILSEASGLVNEISEYKQTVLNTIKNAQGSRKWLGWIMESLVQHMIDELNNFQRIIKSGSDINNDFTDPSILEQISFWTKINAEHVGMASHMLDITYENDTDFRNAYENYFRAQEFIGFNRNEPTNLTPELQAYISTLDIIQQQTKDKIDAGALKSIIHPDLAHHDVREMERAKAALQILSTKQGPVSGATGAEPMTGSMMPMGTTMGTTTQSRSIYGQPPYEYRSAAQAPQTFQFSETSSI